MSHEFSAAWAFFKLLAEWTGLEPATPGVTGRYSNQLNYHSVLVSRESYNVPEVGAIGRWHRRALAPQGRNERAAAKSHRRIRKRRAPVDALSRSDHVLVCSEIIGSR